MWCFLNAPWGPLPRSRAPDKPLAAARTETAQEQVVNLSTARQKFLEPQCRFIYAYFSQDQYLADWHGPPEVISSLPQLQESRHLLLLLSSNLCACFTSVGKGKNNSLAVLCCTEVRKKQTGLCRASLTLGPPTRHTEGKTCHPVFCRVRSQHPPRLALWQPWLPQSKGGI